jgi:hypothetical protein
VLQHVVSALHEHVPVHFVDVPTVVQLLSNKTNFAIKIFDHIQHRSIINQSINIFNHILFDKIIYHLITNSLLVVSIFCL